MIAFIRRTLQFSPLQTLSGGGSDSGKGGGTHDPEGSSPPFRSGMNWSLETTSFHIELKRTWRTIRSGCTPSFGPRESFQETPAAFSSLGSTLMSVHGHRACQYDGTWAAPLAPWFSS